MWTGVNSGFACVMWAGAPEDKATGLRCGGVVGGGGGGGVGDRGRSGKETAAVAVIKLP